MNESTLDKVTALVADKLGVNPADVTHNSRFNDDLGADSLDVVDLIISVETSFGFNVPDDDIEGINTVGELVEYIDKRIAGKSATT